MADDTGPTSSYSDPFYDRLDLIAQQVKRQWALVALILVVFVILGVALQSWLHSRPDATTANAYIDALSQNDKSKREAAMAEVLKSAGNPLFRAKAGIDLADLRLRNHDIAGARSAALAAQEQADKSGQQDLVLVARLSVAAVDEQAGNFGAAETAARGVYSGAANFPATRLAAQLTLARILDAAGRPQEAVDLLEPLLTRNDDGAKGLLDIGAMEYWRIKSGLSVSASAAR